MSEEKFRQLPSVDRVLSDPQIKEIGEALKHETVVDLVRGQLAAARSAIVAGNGAPPFDEVVKMVVREARSLTERSLRPVINATGVILHTNLGRAPLSIEALQAMAQVSQGYCNLEFDLESGERGSRDSHVENLLCQVSGAESAQVVNNNAAAILLGLSALAKRKEVIVSRGEAVEIGGGFRIPDVIRQSGVRLVEVGTTNRTYPEDYEQAITPQTVALLRVHSSNFKITGFTHSVAIAELVELARRHNLMVFDDIGSGCLINTEKYGMEHEPTVQESVEGGASMVFFSGDKLLGGPQSGIIVGKPDLISRLKKHPLTRAVRVDKTRLAGLAVTLEHYLRGEAVEKIPVLRMIATPLADLEMRAAEWARQIGRAAAVVDGESTIGGGSLPGSTLPTRLVAVRPGGEAKVRELAYLLRQHKPAIIGRVARNALLLDPRCVFPVEESALIEAVKEAVAALVLSGQR